MIQALPFTSYDDLAGLGIPTAGVDPDQGDLCYNKLIALFDQITTSPNQAGQAALLNSMNNELDGIQQSRIRMENDLARGGAAAQNAVAWYNYLACEGLKKFSAVTVPQPQVSTGGWSITGANTLFQVKLALEQAQRRAAQAQSDSELPGSPLVVTTSDRRTDCSCRGGTWIDNEYRCAPPRQPTGLRYDPQSSRCVPIAGYRAPFVDPSKSACYSGSWNLCLIGGVAAGLIVLFALIRK